MNNQPMRGPPTLVVTVFLTASLRAQTGERPKTAPAPVPAKQEAAKKDPPTLGFNRLKDVPPIIDSDAMSEGQKLEKELPTSQDTSQPMDRRFQE
jgi:hypothetical protein